MSSHYVITPTPPGILRDTFRSSIRTDKIESNSSIFSSVTIENTPVKPNDGVNKKYVDSIINGLRWKHPCRLATTNIDGNITLSGLQFIDSIMTLEGDRILVKNQMNGAENGYYNASSGTWLRTEDMATGTAVSAYTCGVQEGVVNADKIYVCTNDSCCDIVGLFPLNFSEVSGGITSLNGLTGPIQTFSTGTAGSDFNISSIGDTHTFNLPDASGSTRGLLTSADWTIFNNKGSGDGDVIGPVSSTDNSITRFNGTTGKSIQTSSASIDDSGNLSSTKILVSDGTISLPSISFTNETNTGFYRSASETIKASIGGVDSIVMGSVLTNPSHPGLCQVSIGGISPNLTTGDPNGSVLKIAPPNGSMSAIDIYSSAPSDLRNVLTFRTLSGTRAGAVIAGLGSLNFDGQNTITFGSQSYTTTINIGRTVNTPPTINIRGTTINFGLTTSSIGMYGATPVTRATTAGGSATIAGGGGTSVDDNTTFDGYTLAQVVKALRNIGILT